MLLMGDHVGYSPLNMGSISSESTGTATIFDEHYGRVAVRLNREKPLLANGILPERSIQERSAVVTGIINTLAEQGHWETTLKLLRGDTRLLYDKIRGKDNLETLLAKGVRTSDTVGPDRREAIISSFKEAGYTAALYQISQRKDITPEAALSLLMASKESLNPPTWTEALDRLGRDSMKKNTSIAYEAYKNTTNFEGMRACVESALSNPVQNYNFLKEVIEEQRIKGDSPKGIDNKEIVIRMIQGITSDKLIKDARKKRKGWDVYNLATRYNVIPRLSDTQRVTLERLASESIEDYHVKEPSVPKVIQQLWAEKNWKKSPEEAYKILTLVAPKSRLLLDTAVALWRLERPEEDVDRGRGGYGSTEKKFTKFSKEELKHIYSKTPKKNIHQREVLARSLGDKKELERIGNSRARIAGDDEHENRRAYELFIDSGMPFNHERVVSARRKIIDKEISDALKQGWGGPSTWMIKNEDVEGSLQFYEAMMAHSTFSVTAYEFAKERGWDDKVERARSTILSLKSPEECIRFFREKNDDAGLQRALAILSRETRIPVTELEKLVDLGGEKR